MRRNLLQQQSLPSSKRRCLGTTRTSNAWQSRGLLPTTPGGVLSPSPATRAVSSTARRLAAYVPQLKRLRKSMTAVAKAPVDGAAADADVDASAQRPQPVPSSLVLDKRPGSNSGAHPLVPASTQNGPTTAAAATAAGASAQAAAGAAGSGAARGLNDVAAAAAANGIVVERPLTAHERLLLRAAVAARTDRRVNLMDLIHLCESDRYYKKSVFLYKLYLRLDVSKYK